MKNLNKKELDALANTLLANNPYVLNATEYYKGYTPMYLLYGSSYTKEELDDSYLKTAKMDIEVGFRDRMVGYYDKWYRYNRSDEGRAYDLGVKRALENPKCVGDFNIIEVVEGAL